MAGRIFVSYRRRDTAGYAHLVYDFLRKEFGAKNVFIDVDKIKPGQDFVETLNSAIGVCDVLVVLIGPMWIKVQDASGVKRLEDPKDFVKMEILSALERRKQVIPVLFDGADMPGAEELPQDLKPLATRQAVRIGERVTEDIQRLLIKAVKQAVREHRRARNDRPPGGESFISQTLQFLRSHAVSVSLIGGAFLVLALALAVMIGSWIIGGPESPEPTEAVASGEAPTPPGPSLTEVGPVAVLQWNLEGDRAVLALDQKTWEKYTTDTSHTGLYLRSDDINAFGDFLEIHSDNTFTLEERGAAQTGTWKLEGDQLTLLFTRSAE